jgi:DNA invertase Pin-like site-specific DNA recombinase
MGRLTLNVLLSFAQFEREVTGERIRDKIAASKRKGIWMGGCPSIGAPSCGVAKDHKAALCGVSENVVERLLPECQHFVEFTAIDHDRAYLHLHDSLPHPLSDALLD